MKQADEKTPWVERETTVEASPDEVWEALTDEDRLEEWLAPDVELDPIEGGEIVVRDGEDERFGTVETVEEAERFAFTWSRPGEGESFVEFTIEALPGGSRVTVVETPNVRRPRTPWPDLPRWRPAGGGRGSRVCNGQCASRSSLEGAGAPTGRFGLRRTRRSDASASGRDPRPRRHGDGERPRGAAADHPAGRRQAPLRSARRRARHLDAGRPRDALRAAATAARRGGPVDPDGERRVGRPARSLRRSIEKRAGRSE